MLFIDHELQQNSLTGGDDGPSVRQTLGKNTHKCYFSAHTDYIVITDICTFDMLGFTSQDCSVQASPTLPSKPDYPSYLQCKHSVHHASGGRGISNNVHFKTSSDEIQSGLLNTHVRLQETKHSFRVSCQPVWGFCYISQQKECPCPLSHRSQCDLRRQD